MKKTLLLALALAAFITSEARQHIAKFSGDAKEVRIYFSNATIEVEGYNGRDVVIRGGSEEKKPARAQGLTPLYAVAEDNTGVGLNIEERDGVMEIRKISSRNDGNYVFKVPANLDLQIVEQNWQGDHIIISGMRGEIDIESKNSDIELGDVQGPIYAKTTSGDIMATFQSINPNRSTQISSVSGTVDVTIPQTLGAFIELSSVTGDVYSDFDFNRQVTKDGMRRIGGRGKTRGEINGGGPRLALKSVSDDVYLRKSN